MKMMVRYGWLDTWEILDDKIYQDDILHMWCCSSNIPFTHLSSHDCWQGPQSPAWQTSSQVWRPQLRVFPHTFAHWKNRSPHLNIHNRMNWWNILPLKPAILSGAAFWKCNSSPSLTFTLSTHTPHHSQYPHTSSLSVPTHLITFSSWPQTHVKDPILGKGQKKVFHWENQKTVFHWEGQTNKC